jgi:hypothetical protein
MTPFDFGTIVPVRFPLTGLVGSKIQWPRWDIKQAYVRGVLFRPVSKIGMAGSFLPMSPRVERWEVFPRRRPVACAREQPRWALWRAVSLMTP